MTTLTFTRTRVTATALAVLAALTLTISGPAAIDAKIKGVDGAGSVTAMYKPGPPPVWCGIVRFCPYESGV